MNRKMIDTYIPLAYEAMKQTGIAKENKGRFEVSSVFRGYISSFGAAITMGGLRSSVMFFSKETDKTEADRTLLMDAIYQVIQGERASCNKNLATLVNEDASQAMKEKILNASIALKLAMNLFYLK